MLIIDSNGVVQNPKITKARFPTIERGPMKSISGIVVHQTGAASAKSTINSYHQNFANGAHFLIDKNGAIYQTASVYRQTWHVGKLKARCLMENRCTAEENKALKKFNPTAEHKREVVKSAPNRFPGNQDSIGIELVGEVTHNGNYATVTSEQNTSLSWLVSQLTKTLSLRSSEVFRHPTVSRKNPTEASSATW